MRGSIFCVIEKPWTEHMPALVCRVRPALRHIALHTTDLAHANAKQWRDPHMCPLAMPHVKSAPSLLQALLLSDAETEKTTMYEKAATDVH